MPLPLYRILSRIMFPPTPPQTISPGIPLAPIILPSLLDFGVALSPATPLTSLEYIIEDIETSYWGKGEVMYSKSITRGGCSNQDTIVNRFKKVVDVINKKFFDNSYSVFGSVDHWIQQISFAQNLIFIRKKSMKDCIHEVKYRWSKRLSSDCPANRRNNFKDQRLDRDLKLMCSS